MNIIIPCRHQLWCMVCYYAAYYVLLYCEHHFDEYVRVGIVTRETCYTSSIDQ